MIEILDYIRQECRVDQTVRVHTVNAADEASADAGRVFGTDVNDMEFTVEELQAAAAPLGVSYLDPAAVIALIQQKFGRSVVQRPLPVA